MTPLVTFAQTSTYELTPPGYRLSPSLWKAFTTINKIHSIWRWYRKIEVYRNPNNFAQLLAGHIVNLAIGDMLLLRIAAQCLLISTRILECAQQQTILYISVLRWIEAIQGHYPKPCHYSWKNTYCSLWSSPSSYPFLGINHHALWDRVKRISACTLAIFIHFFKLSMCIMDAIDAFCLNPQTRNEGINEGFVNAMKWLDQLVENKEELLHGIISNRSLIEKILQGSPITYDQLHTGITKTLENTEGVYLKAKEISNLGNGILVDLGKRILNGGMVITGFSKYF